jgi:hypothetical protein
LDLAAAVEVNVAELIVGGGAIVVNCRKLWRRCWWWQRSSVCHGISAMRHHFLTLSICYLCCLRASEALVWRGTRIKFELAMTLNYYQAKWNV